MSYKEFEEFRGLIIFLLKILGKFRGKIIIFMKFGGPILYFSKNLENFKSNFIKLENFGRAMAPTLLSGSTLNHEVKIIN